MVISILGTDFSKIYKACSLCLVQANWSHKNKLRDVKMTPQSRDGHACASRIVLCTKFFMEYLPAVVSLLGPLDLVEWSSQSFAVHEYVKSLSSALASRMCNSPHGRMLNLPPSEDIKRNIFIQVVTAVPRCWFVVFKHT